MHWNDRKIKPRKNIYLEKININTYFIKKIPITYQRTVIKYGGFYLNIVIIVVSLNSHN